MCGVKVAKALGTTDLVLWNCLCLVFKDDVLAAGPGRSRGFEGLLPSTISDNYSNEPQLDAAGDDSDKMISGR